MKYLITITYFLLLFQTLSAQVTDLAPFERIVSGPHIELYLQHGPSESIDFIADEVDIDEVIYKIIGKTLHIYLRDARNIEKTKTYKKAGAKWSAGVYKDATVKVTVMYQNLKKLITKGEKAITVNGLIDSPSFTYKSYGDQKVNFAMVQTQIFKAKLYGASNLTIQNGFADLQRYKLYGDHSINTKNVKSEHIKTTNYGQARLDVASAVIALTSFGYADINCPPNTTIKKRIVIGDTNSL